AANAATANAAQARGRSRSKGAASRINTRSSTATAATRPSRDSAAACASSGYAIAAAQRSANAARATAAPASAGLVLLDMRGERAQRREDAAVVGAVRTQLEAVTLADGERKLERVDRVQSQAGVEQRRLRIDVAGGDAFQVQAFDQQLRQRALGVGLRGHPGF